jgi:hypothetical protein
MGIDQRAGLRALGIGMNGTASAPVHRDQALHTVPERCAVERTRGRMMLHPPAPP